MARAPESMTFPSSLPGAADVAASGSDEAPLWFMRQRTASELVAAINALPARRRTKYMRVHSIRDVAAWIRTLTDRELSTALAMLRGEETS